MAHWVSMLALQVWEPAKVSSNPQNSHKSWTCGRNAVIVTQLLGNRLETGEFWKAQGLGSHMKLWTTKRSCFETKWKVRANTSDLCTSISMEEVHSLFSTKQQKIYSRYMFSVFSVVKSMCFLVDFALDYFPSYFMSNKSSGRTHSYQFVIILKTGP